MALPWSWGPFLPQNCVYGSSYPPWLMSRTNLLWGGGQALATSQAGQSGYLVPSVGGTMGQRGSPLPLPPSKTITGHIHLLDQCYKYTPLKLLDQYVVPKHQIQNHTHKVSSTPLTRIHRRRETHLKIVGISEP